MELSILKYIINNSFVNDSLISALDIAVQKYNINTGLRQCHFLAQIIHESGAFRYTKEIASGKLYEFRRDLGNTNPGDGVKYKGRGLIQITGKNNYSELSKAFDFNFIDQPEYLETYPYAALSAGWYWNSRALNFFADKDDLLTITRKINGGTNGLDDRKKWLLKCKEILL